MTQIRIPAAWMRGGTSKGLFVLADDLPADPAVRDALLARALGSPDPYGKQIDGLGGATSSTSKVVLVARSRRPGCDLDYWFGQVPVDSERLDWSGNCGNLTAAVAPFALARGLIAAPADGEITVRLWQGNLGERIDARLAVRAGRALETGEFRLDGVAFPGAPVELVFRDPGSAEGGILPTGRPLDTLAPTDGGTLDATLLSAGNPMVFVAADALGVDGTAGQAALNADPARLARCERIRIAGALAMGLADTPDGVAAHTPKLALVAPPADCRAADGRQIGASELDLLTRVLSMGVFHHAVPGTAAIALAAAAGVPGTVVARQLVRPPGATLRVGHPSGRVTVGARLVEMDGRWRVEAATLPRSARMLMDGWVCLPA